MDHFKLSCQVSPTNPNSPLGLEITVNDQVAYSNKELTNTSDFQYFFDDLSDTENQQWITVKFRLFGKTQSHTKINDAGDILEDSLINFKNFYLMDIDITELVNTIAVYTHDANGTQPESEYKFFGTMGCNGTVVFKFSTPVYLWLLENL